MGVLGTLFSQIHAKFTAPQHLDTPLNGKIFVVTGGLTGIGYHTSLNLALRGATVYAGVRSVSRGQGIVAAMPLPAGGQGKVVPFECDFSTFKSAADAAQRVKAATGRIDGLVNNAGRLANYGPYELGENGVELLVAVNHFGLVIFTKAVLPLLEATSKLPGSDVRIVNVASNAAMFSPNWQIGTAWDTFNSTLAPNESKVNDSNIQMLRYGVSKMFPIGWTMSLQEKLVKEQSNIITVSLHPGGVATDNNHFAKIPIVGLMFLTPSQGALTSLFALTSPTIRAKEAQYKGKYLHPYGKITTPEVKTIADPATRQKLWDMTEEVIAAGGLKKP
ncbi:NAD-P-binding protein [Pseudohyphozyma bogoriensis]|nr:NAD-P-binding protein [Pseudohyphozyma bogoriensis]